MVAHELARLLHRSVDRLAGRLEAEHENRLAIVRCLCERRLLGIEQAAVRRVEARLRERANGLHPGRKGVERGAA